MKKSIKIITLALSLSLLLSACSLSGKENDKKGQKEKEVSASVSEKPEEKPAEEKPQSTDNKEENPREENKPEALDPTDIEKPAEKKPEEKPQSPTSKPDDKKPSNTQQPKDPVFTSKDITKKEKISFKTKTILNSSLAKGKEKVSKEGRNGEKILTYRVTYKDGKEISRKLVSSKTTLSPQDRIVLVGTNTKQPKAPASKVKPQQPKAPAKPKTPTKPKTKPASKKKYRRIGSDKVEVLGNDGIYHVYFIGPANSGRWFRNEKECLNYGWKEASRRNEKGLSTQFYYGRFYDLRTQTVKWSVNWEKDDQLFEDM